MSKKNSSESELQKIQKELDRVRERVKILEKENERFRKIAEFSCDLISIHDENGKFVYASDASKTILGYEPEDLIGRNPAEIIHEEDIVKVLEYRQSILDGGKGKDFVLYRMRHSNGSWVWFESRSKSFTSGDKGLLLMVSSCDVTRQIKLRQEMEASHYRYKSLVENIPFILFRFDRNLKVTYVSPDVSSLFSFTQKELTGAFFSRPHFSPEKIILLKEYISKVFEEHNSLELESEQETKLGNRSMKWIFVPEYSQDGDR